jgi:hypothetical protein
MRLLAASIIGAAGKCPAGLKFGHLQKIGEGYGKKGQKVLKPALRQGLDDATVARLSGEKWASVAKLQQVSLGGKPEAAKVEELVGTLGMEGLKQIAHPRAVQYICGASGGKGSKPAIA